MVKRKYDRNHRGTVNTAGNGISGDKRKTPMSPQAVEALGLRYAPGWLRKKVLVRDGYKCYRCGVRVTDTTANVDHVVPWPWGMTEASNLRAICRPCNQSKGRRFPRPAAHWQDPYTGQWFGKKTRKKAAVLPQEAHDAER